MTKNDKVGWCWMQRVCPHLDSQRRNAVVEVLFSSAVAEKCLLGSSGYTPEPVCFACLAIAVCESALDAAVCAQCGCHSPLSSFTAGLQISLAFGICFYIFYSAASRLPGGTAREKQHSIPWAEHSEPLLWWPFRTASSVGTHHVGPPGKITCPEKTQRERSKQVKTFCSSPTCPLQRQSAKYSATLCV